MANFRNDPIVRGLNPHTGLLEGDDAGYRKVRVSPLDAKNPDPLVPLDASLALPVYSKGQVPGLCTYYPGGLGGPDVVLVRSPMARGLFEAAIRLREYRRSLLVLDGFRPWQVQQNLWRYLRASIVEAEGLVDGQLSISDEVRIGCRADDVGSYCALVEGEEFRSALQVLQGTRAEEIKAAAAELGKTSEEIAKLFLTFEANLGRNTLRIEQDAVTAHGNGGAVDLWMTNWDTGKYVNLGVPFDYVPPPRTDISPALMNYFELVEPDHYREMVKKDPTLQQYLSELGVARVMQVADAVFYEALAERRILFHTMRSLGATYYSLEPWHFQLGNEWGGNQANVAGLAGSGNGCHAKLKGMEEAVWGNATGHKLAAAFLKR